MTIGSIFTAFEACYTETFKDVVKTKLNVHFRNSNINHIREQLELVRTKIISSNVNPVRGGYEITLSDVEHIQQLLDTIVNTYMTTFNLTTLPERKKIYDIKSQLQQASSPTTEQMARDVVKQILTPPQAPKQTKKQSIKEKAKAKTLARSLDTLRKTRPKNEG